jgi:hypothetical protein
MEDFGTLINDNFTDKSGIIGSLYQNKPNVKILIHNTNIKKGFGYEGIIYKNDLEYCKFTDKTIGDDTFLRTISNTTIKYIKNKIVYIDNKINSKIIEPLKIDLSRDTNYGSFDIETALNNNKKFSPVSCGWYTKNKSKLYFVWDFDSIDHMFKQCFTDMINQGNYTWYTHNLGGFDSVFMLKTLLNVNPKTKFNFKDGKPLSIRSSFPITKGKKVNNLIFKDSLKLLPLKLKKLIEEYRVDTNKLDFPYRFMTLDKLDYCGKLPDKSFYEDISDSEYETLVNDFKDKDWNLKFELAKYMNNDIIALYKILDIFSQEMYDLENLNITDVSSISSTALKTYLSNYYNKNKSPIYIPRYKNYIDIKNAYYGGRVEVFKGYAENIYIYNNLDDIISLNMLRSLKDLFLLL